MGFFYAMHRSLPLLVYFYFYKFFLSLTPHLPAFEDGFFVVVVSFFLVFYFKYFFLTYTMVGEGKAWGKVRPEIKAFGVSNQWTFKSIIIVLLNLPVCHSCIEKNQRYSVVLACGLGMWALTKTLSDDSLGGCIYMSQGPHQSLFGFNFFVYISLKSDILSVCMRNAITNKMTAYSWLYRVRKVHALLLLFKVSF